MTDPEFLDMAIPAAFAAGSFGYLVFQFTRVSIAQRRLASEIEATSKMIDELLARKSH